MAFRPNEPSGFRGRKAILNHVTHWPQLVPNRSTDIRGLEALLQSLFRQLAQTDQLQAQHTFGFSGAAGKQEGNPLRFPTGHDSSAVARPCKTQLCLVTQEADTDRNPNAKAIQISEENNFLIVSPLLHRKLPGLKQTNNGIFIDFLIQIGVK